MRKLHPWFLLAPLGALYIGLAPGCAEKVCTEDSHLLEMRVSFSGFDRSSADRLELETWVAAPPPVGAEYEFLETRRGSLVFPAEGRDGTLTLLVDPGGYIAGLGTAEYQLTFILRVYGTRNGTPNLLLAEGRYSNHLAANGCHLGLNFRVTASRQCEDKVEGEPCVGTGSNRAVCKDSTGTLICDASTCGDGFTDRRQGELCDLAQTTVPCDANCIPLPIELEVNRTGTSPALSHATLINRKDQDSETRGLHELAFASDASPVPAGALLIADFDGDGADELAWGFPEGFDNIGNERVGRVSIKDHPVGDQIIGNPENDFSTFYGPDGPEPSWLGASLAAGDVNGDGVQDLIMGAPNDHERAGAMYVVYGGADQQLRPASNRDVVEFGSVADMEAYQVIPGQEGPIAGNAGDHLGYALAAGDFDGDGITDLAVSAPGRSDPAILQRGEVYVLRGGQPFWQTGYSPNNIVELAELRLYSHHDDARLGVALAAGDLDGDGRAELIIGSEVSRDPGSSPGYGAAHVIFGASDIFDTSPGGVNLDTPPPQDTLDVLSLAAATSGAAERGIGGAIAVGDLDGDGLGEIALTLGRRGSVESPHTVVLVPGTAITRYRETGTLPDLAADALWLEGTTDEAFGASVHIADVNRDGTSDLLVGAPHYSYTAPPAEFRAQAGALYVLLGSSRAPYWQASSLLVEEAMAGTTTVQLPWIRLYGKQAGGLFGTAAAASPHLSYYDLQPWPHIYVMAPGWDYDPPNNINSGRVWVVAPSALLPCGSHDLCPAP